MHLADIRPPPVPVPVPVPVPTPSVLAGAERAFGLFVDGVAALLVVAEIALLLSGVVKRYVFHNPLTWSDKLASILFLWLSMLGAVCALRRGEHMRMTGLVTRVGPAARAFRDALAVVAPLAILVLLLPHALDYAREEGFIVTAALEISNSWRAAALPAGIALMIVASLLRLLAGPRRVTILPAMLVTLLIAGGLWFAGPALKPLGQLNLVIFAMGIRLFAPPFGVGYYGACAISRIHPDEGMRDIWAYMSALLVGLVLAAAIPWFYTGFL